MPQPQVRFGMPYTASCISQTFGGEGGETFFRTCTNSIQELGARNLLTYAGGCRYLHGSSDVGTGPAKEAGSPELPPRALARTTASDTQALWACVEIVPGASSWVESCGVLLPDSGAVEDVLLKVVLV